MKSYKIPAWRKAQIARENRRKSKVINKAVSDTESALKKATERIIDAGMVSGVFFKPSLNEINVISDDFYISVIREAYYSCEDEKEDQVGRKRLATGPKGVPKTLEELSDIFQDKKYFKAIMKRSSLMSEKLKKGYLRKLKNKFKEVFPLIQSGEMTPAMAKKEMMSAWGATKSRVNTIYKTETTNYFTKVQTSYFREDPGIIGFIFHSKMEMSTTDICESRNGLVFTKHHTGINSLAENSPSLHYNCGSKLIPLANTPENRKLLEDPSRDPVNRKLVPLPDGWR